MTEIEENVASLRAIPDGLIDEAYRAVLIARAEHGEDVRAYCTGFFWNVWDGGAVDRDTGYKGVRVEIGALG